MPPKVKGTGQPQKRRNLRSPPDDSVFSSASTTTAVRLGSATAAAVPVDLDPVVRTEREERQWQRNLETRQFEVLSTDLTIDVAERRPWAPGRFAARFVRVGQGDCILLKTPGGKIVMVDCGSSSWDGGRPEDGLQFVRDSIFAPPFLGGGHTVIDVLVLTHADRDHYNLIGDVLGDRATVNRVYHGNELAEYTDARDWITDHGPAPERVQRVIYNKDAEGGEITLRSHASSAVPPPVPGGDGEDQLDAQGGLRILVEDGRFTLSILASRVSKDHFQSYVQNGATSTGGAKRKRTVDPGPHTNDGDTKKIRNRGSIVLLAEFTPAGQAPSSLLLVGDATRSTERYLFEKSPYAAQNRLRLAQVTAVQIGHHGSFKTSSHPEYVDLFENLKTAVCSSGNPGMTRHYLPRWSALRHWWGRLEHTQIAQDPHHGRVWRATVSGEPEYVLGITVDGQTLAVEPDIDEEDDDQEDDALAEDVDEEDDDALAGDDVPPVMQVLKPAAAQRVMSASETEDGSEGLTSTVDKEVKTGLRRFVRKNLSRRALFITGSHGNIDLSWPDP